MPQRYLAIASVAAGLAASAGGTHAQENALAIDQRGTGNTLSVDQSAASGSWIGGLTLTAPNAPVEALSIDRTTDIARQAGVGNQAAITLTGEGARVGLLQTNSQAGGAGNVATVVASGRSASTVSQVGAGNRASVDVTGDLSRGSVLQTGDNNSGRVTVSGGGSGTLIQNGSNNDRSVSVAGGTVATIVQNGSGLTDTASNAAIASAVAGQGGLPAGVQILSNAAAVEITQTALPGIVGR